MTHFTLLIAVYNTEKFLDECLQSLLSQTHKEWQAICINDCSTDGSLAILEHYQQKDSRFKVISTPHNSGLAVARNSGLPYAEGDYTLMLDSDDYLAPDALQTLWEAHLQHPEADALLFNLTKIWEDGRTEPWKWPDQRRLLSGKEAFVFSIDWQIHGCFALRTPINLRIPFDTTLRIYSDDVTVRIHLLECREVALCEGTYYYRQHTASATHHLNMNRLDFLDANQLLRKQLEQRNVDNHALQICENMIWKIFVGVFREMYTHRQQFNAKEKKEIKRRLLLNWKAIRPERISAELKSNISYWIFPSFSLFAAWQRILLWGRRLVKGYKK